MKVKTVDKDYPLLRNCSETDLSNSLVHSTQSMDSHFLNACVVPGTKFRYNRKVKMTLAPAFKELTFLSNSQMSQG